LRIRPGDSAADRLVRARNLARLAPNDPESRLTIARAALEARDFASVRAAVAPLLDPDSSSGRPSVRVCLLMADLEETQGSPGAVREWLARAARAPRDRAWVADGFVSDRWAPVSPGGKLDVFVWRAPEEQLSARGETTPAGVVEERVETPDAIAPPVEAPPSQAEASPPIVGSERVAASPKIVAIAPPEISHVAPDDPGAQPAPAKRGGFRLFS
jgi:HemY protein